MAFKKNVKNTVINIANYWGPDKTTTVILGTALGALCGAFISVVSIDSKPMEFIENNEEEN